MCRRTKVAVECEEATGDGNGAARRGSKSSGRNKCCYERRHDFVSLISGDGAGRFR